MECFTHCGWRGSAVSEARTDLKDSLKVLRGKVVQDPSLKTLQVRQISSQPSSADPSEGSAAAFEVQAFPFTQEFYSVMESLPEVRFSVLIRASDRFRACQRRGRCTSRLPPLVASVRSD